MSNRINLWTINVTANDFQPSRIQDTGCLLASDWSKIVPLCCVSAATGPCIQKSIFNQSELVQCMHNFVEWPLDMYHSIEHVSPCTVCIQCIRKTDHTEWMPRLIWVFTGRTSHCVGFDMLGLIYQIHNQIYMMRYTMNTDEWIKPCIMYKYTMYKCNNVWGRLLFELSMRITNIKFKRAKQLSVRMKLYH